MAHSSPLSALDLFTEDFKKRNLEVNVSTVYEVETEGGADGGLRVVLGYYATTKEAQQAAVGKGGFGGDARVHPLEAVVFSNIDTGVLSYIVPLRHVIALPTEDAETRRLLNRLSEKDLQLLAKHFEGKK